MYHFYTFKASILSIFKFFFISHQNVLRQKVNADKHSFRIEITSFIMERRRTILDAHSNLCKLIAHFHLYNEHQNPVVVDIKNSSCLAKEHNGCPLRLKANGTVLIYQSLVP